MAEPAQRQQSVKKLVAAYLIAVIITTLILISWLSNYHYRTQLLGVPEKIIQSSNATSRKMHSIVIRTTQVIFSHDLTLQDNSFLRAKVAITVKKSDTTHISIVVTRRTIIPPLSPTSIILLWLWNAYHIPSSFIVYGKGSLCV